MNHKYITILLACNFYAFTATSIYIEISCVQLDFIYHKTI
jgi:hypothetical protein